MTTATATAVAARRRRLRSDLHLLTGWAMQHDTLLAGLTVDRPSLEDVYLRLTNDGAPAGVPERTTR